MIQVNSNAITAIGYDEASQRMEITFLQGYTYDYCRVPRYVLWDYANPHPKVTTTTCISKTSTRAKRSMVLTNYRE